MKISNKIAKSLILFVWLVATDANVLVTFPGSLLGIVDSTWSRIKSCEGAIGLSQAKRRDNSTPK